MQRAFMHGGGAVIDVADNAVISADGKNSRGVVAQHTNAEIT